MNMRDLVPWTRTNDRERALAVSQEPSTPFFTLQREMNRLFEDAFRGFDMPLTWGRSTWPQIEIEDNDAEYRVTAELPGMDEKDVEILFQDDVLILRGEKRVDNEDRKRAFSERFYGRFERRIPLDGVDESRVRADFRNGVLTVTAPRSAQAKERVKRIPINQSSTTH